MHWKDLKYLFQSFLIRNTFTQSVTFECAKSTNKNYGKLTKPNITAYFNKKKPLHINFELYREPL